MVRFNIILITLIVSLCGMFSFYLLGDLNVVSADSVVEKLQQKYNGLKAISANFSQSLFNPKMGTTLTESGNLVIKKGGYIRWDYKEPEEKLFICNGKVCYFYIVEESIVQKISMEKYDFKKTPMLFLLGRGNIRQDFKIDLITDTEHRLYTDKYYLLRLYPIATEESYEYLLISVNKSNFLIERLLIMDLIGNETDYVFRDYKELNDIPDDLFQFSVPEGVEEIEVEE